MGRINADKGINELVSAFASLSEKKSDVYLVMMGMLDESNPISEESLSIANSMPNIVMTGAIPKEQVYRHMAMYDVLVHPTYREGFGKVLQEAMGMECPIITTDVPGPSEVIEDGVSGALVPVRDADALQLEMINLMNDSVRRNGFAKAGRVRAETYFERSVMLNNILEDYRKILDITVEKKTVNV